MTDNKWNSIVDYLQSKAGFNDRNFTTIREQYQKKCGGSFPKSQDESAIKDVADQLKIKIQTAESLELLCDCVRSSSAEDSRIVAKARCNDRIEPYSTTTLDVSSPSNVDDNATLLTKIDCLLTIKMAFPEVSTFIRSFLLQPIGASFPLYSITEPTSNLISNQQSFVLPVQCPLYLFIRQQMHERGTTTSVAHRNSTRLRLVEPISSNDDFGTWTYDHWHGLFDVELKPHGDHAQFPEHWRLAHDVTIHCRVETCNSREKTSLPSHMDRPRTATLDVFIHDVCARENNGQSKSWLEALEKEDIFRFKDLTNLSQSEWDKIHKLTVHAKKILKAAVDRERTSTTAEYRRQVTQDPDDENKGQTEVVNLCFVESSSMSGSELSANLHLIKLFVWHQLRDQQAVQRHGALAKLEMKCLDTAFKEMQSEGFADDGLFLKIRDFFLPLTISQQELNLERSSSMLVQGARLTRREELRESIKRYKIQLKREKDADQKCDEETLRIKQMIKDHEAESSGVLTTWKSNKNSKKQKKQLEDLHQFYQNCHRRQANLLQKLHEMREKKDDICKRINNLNNELEATKARLERIETELNTPHKPVDERLVKPPRGLIMYGPPGTGKSTILTQLAKKLGIIMVGPPLAAGDLNRPLVGESERILNALCSRGYQVPYAMCCISIDEIDSLAPKRNEDSTEGKVDKISVLLSLIDGIKDVPNLMILSATNRLHMMDEAFLRRMSGKFFVGRPSSNARLSMLRKIPCWALEPELLDRLSIATTNFSGAAVKALVGAITVKCIEMQRTDSNYQICETEALQMTDLTAQQYQILIGSETLPRLLLRNKLADSHHSRTHQLLPNCKYTGRIIVDLHSKCIRIELSEQEKATKNYQSSITEHQLYPNEINVQTLLERLTAYGKSRNVQLLQLIDLNLLASQGAYDEKKVYETLKDRYDECVAYPRSMIVYDLDALVGVNKSEADSNMGRSTSCSIHNQSIYTYVLARFRDRAMEDVQGDATNNVERWAIAVIREPFLLRQFCADAQYPRTRQEEEELELERHKAEDLLKCVKCKDFYIENENRMGNCVHHDGFIFDNEAADLTIHSPSEVAKLLRELDRKAVKYPNRLEEFERQKTKFKWICCDEIFTGAHAGGCKRGKHGFSLHGNDSTSRPLTYGRINRLNTTAIEEWEDACRINEEYNEKWITLLKEY